MGFSVGSITNLAQGQYHYPALGTLYQSPVAFGRDQAADPFERAVEGLREFIIQYGRRSSSRPDRLVVGADALGTPDLRKKIGYSRDKESETNRSYDLSLVDKPNHSWLSSLTGQQTSEPILILDVQDISHSSTGSYQHLRLYADMRGQIAKVEESDAKSLLRTRRPTIEEKWLLLDAYHLAQDYMHKQLEAPKPGELISSSLTRETMARHNPVGSPSAAHPPHPRRRSRP